MFLGIDHTAIVVADTERSLRLYRDLLGMKVVGRSENYGPEQERLNDVAGARLRITTLRASSGPGVELLEYLTPRNGRPLPADATLNDLIGWRTVLTVSSPAALAPLFGGTGATMISPRVVAVPQAAGPRDEVVIRDVDGHALHLRSR